MLTEIGIELESNISLKQYDNYSLVLVLGKFGGMSDEFSSLPFSGKRATLGF